MLKQTTIDKVREVPIDQVVGKYVELKKQGANFMGLSPFTEEKTPSFSVSPSKGIWKCFSTGAGGGDGISFIMKLKHPCDFIDAVKIIANDFNIPLEYDDTDKAKKAAEKQDQVRKLIDINALALDFYTENIKNAPDKARVRATPDMEELFSLGYAPDSWHALTNHLTNLGVSKQQMVTAGLVKKNKEGKYYDFFRNRIMFPVFSRTGQVIGFSGRDLSENPDKKTAKYLNTPQTIAYDKSKILLGLYQAREHIVKMGYATIVEGNYGVTSTVQHKLLNTVAPCGSAFTEEQADELLKLTDTFLLFVDNDNAGLKKIDINTRMLIQKKAKVFVLIPPIEGEDPDDFCKRYDGELLDFVEENKKDAIEYLAEDYFASATSIIEKDEAQKKLVELVALVPDSPLRNSYTKEFATRYKLLKKDVESAVATVIVTKHKETQNLNAAPDYVVPSHIDEDDKKDWEEFGFYPDKRKEAIGYYFASQNFKFERVSNFVLTPLFHVEAQQDSNRYAEMENHREKKVIEIPNKAFVSVQKFDETCTDHGNFWFNGTNKHFQKLRAKLLSQFPRVASINTLGWQPEGFWAFSDGIVDGGFKRITDNGLVTYDSNDYFLPAFSSIFKKIKSENDAYENDRHFKYRPSGITMQQWSGQMLKVYDHNNNGIWAVLFTIASMFRDHIHGSLSIFPHLFMFGQPQTGKTTMAISINKIFFGDQPGFNLNQGTQPGFYRRLARTRNAVVWLEEYSNDIDARRFEALKGIYDGTGHEKGSMTRDNRTETTKVNSAVSITSQFIPTRNDNSLLSRSILLTFQKLVQDFTPEEVKEFNKLNEWESQGLSDLIIETVKYRDYFTENFRNEFDSVEQMLKRDLDGEEYVGRILKNFSILVTTCKILGEKLKLAISYEQSVKYAKESILKMSEQYTDSDALRTYWSMIEFLSMQHHIQYGADYKIEKLDTIKIREGRKGYKDIQLKPDTRVLFISLTRIHPLYMEHYKRQHSEGGFTESTIKSFMNSSKYFFGNVASTKFDHGNTSAFAFDYDKLGITLRGDGTVATPPTTPSEVTTVSNGDDDDLPF